LLFALFRPEEDRLFKRLLCADGDRVPAGFLPRLCSSGAGTVKPATSNSTFAPARVLTQALVDMPVTGNRETPTLPSTFAEKVTPYETDGGGLRGGRGESVANQ